MVLIFKRKRNRTCLPFVLTLILTTTITACSHSSLSPTSERDLWVAGAFVAAGAVGALTAPPSESGTAHAVLWGGVAGTLAALASNHFVNSPPAGVSDSQMKQDLELFQTGKSVLEQEGSGVFTDRQGQTLLSGQKAKWKIHSTDRWVKDGPTHLHHVDHDVEVTPLTPAPPPPTSPPAP